MPGWHLWAQSIDTDDAVGKRPGGSRACMYERLVTDPETELKTLCAALADRMRRFGYEPLLTSGQRAAVGL
jgi:hypothetical protein